MIVSLGVSNQRTLSARFDITLARSTYCKNMQGDFLN